MLCLGVQRKGVVQNGENPNRKGEKLLPEERLLFYRKYYYLQTTARIAAELGMTERAVEGKLYRLKRRLRKMLGGDQNG